MTYMPVECRTALAPAAGPRARPLAPLAAAFASMNRWWVKRRAERAIEALPLEVRKDIGWPGIDREG